MHPTYKQIIIVILALIASFPASMQARKMDYSNLDLIPLETDAWQARCFVQDREGFIWIGTNQGLCRYDGYRVTAQYEAGSQYNLPVNALAIWQDRYIFIGTDSGLKMYDMLKDAYIHISLGPNAIVRSVLTDGGNILIGSSSGLYTYDLERYVFGNETDIPEQHLSLPGAAVYSIVRVREMVFVGTFQGLFRYERVSGTYRQIRLGGSGNVFINSLLADEDSGKLLIGWNGLWVYDVYTGDLEHVIDRAAERSLSFSAKTLAIDSDGRIVIGSDEGLHVFDPQNRESEHYLHDLRVYNSLSNNIVQSVYRDKSDNIWIGTDFGISLARPSKPYKYVSLAEINREGEGNQIFFIQRDSRHYLWFGGNNGALRYDPDTGESIRYRSSRDAGPSGMYHIAHNRIRDIYTDSSGNLWLLSDGGAALYDYGTGTFTTHTARTPEGSSAGSWPYKIIEDGSEHYWVSTYMSGLYEVGRDDFLGSTRSVIRRRFSVENGLSSNYVSTILYDEGTNTVWALINRGCLERIDCRSGEIRHVDVLKATQGRCPSCMIPSADGRIWIGHAGGLVSVDPTDLSMEPFPYPNDEKISTICMAEVEGNIWACTNYGVFVLRDDGQWDLINVEGRVFSSIFNDTYSGNVILGDSDGFATIDSRTPFQNESSSPNLLVSRIWSGGESIVSKDGTAGRHLCAIHLSRGQTNLTVEVANLSFGSSDLMPLVFTEDPGSGWTELPKGSNVITISRLRPGKHRIHYACKGAGGKIVGENRIDVRIDRPLGGSAGALVCYGVFFLVLSYWMIRFLKLQIMYRHEQEDRRRVLAQADEKMKFYTDISHEFKTPLSMILAPVSHMLSSPHDEADTRDLQRIHENAIKLNSLIHQAIEYDRSKPGHELSLIRSRLDVVGLVRTIMNSFSENQKEGSREFIFTSEIERFEMMGDAVKLESVFNNLISNAVKYTNDGDSILASISLEDKSSITLKVSDTGTGIPSKELPYIFHRFYKSPTNSIGREGTGVGLSMVKEYVELHGGSVSVESKVGEGSSFTVKLPRTTDVEDNDAAIEPPVTDGLPTIAIIDDNIAITDFLVELFSKEYRCVVAHNGKNGLRLCRDVLPDLIISDILMPVMGGIEMCTRLREDVSTSTIPIIMLTAVDDTQYEILTANLKIDAYIVKPFESGIIYARAKALVEKRLDMENRIRIQMISEPRQIDAQSTDEKFLTKMVEIIEENLSDSEFNVTALCEQLDMSSKQVYRKCRQMVGMSPVEYIRTVRLKKAAMLLEQHNFNISEIMYMVGFSNSSYFSKSFAAEFGMTPQQYRKSKKERDI